MSKSQWDEAARKAAESIEYSKKNAPDEWFLIPITEMTEIIAKNHADLRATYEKLVELVVRQEKYITVLNRCDSIRTADENVNRKLLNDLRNDPLVKSAIERSKKV